MTPAEEVPGLVDELKELLPRLAALLPEPVANPTQGTMSHHKVVGSPAPWHAEAANAFMTVHAGARELELKLKYQVSRRLAEARGGSDQNTIDALDSIVRLVYGVPDDLAREVRHAIERWIEQARQVQDIGESEKWIPVYVPKGQIPPVCLYCGTLSLRVAQQSGQVRCGNPRCADENGKRPHGWIEKNRVDGSAVLVWADGRLTHYYEREAS